MTGIDGLIASPRVRAVRGPKTGSATQLHWQALLAAGAWRAFGDPLLEVLGSARHRLSAGSSEGPVQREGLRRRRQGTILRGSLLGSVRRCSRAEVAAQGGEERVGLGLRGIETADEAGEGLAAAVELEALCFERVHYRAWQLKENFVHLDRRQKLRRGNIAQPGGDARCHFVGSV